MSCCGTARDASHTSATPLMTMGTSRNPGAVTNTQPSPSPGLNIAPVPFVLPTLTQPPPVQSASHHGSEYGVQPSQWGVNHPTSPTYDGHRGPAPLLSPTHTGSAFGQVSSPAESIHGRAGSVRGSVIGVPPSSIHRGQSVLGPAASLRGKQLPSTPPVVEEGRFVVAIDFGTTFSGVAYASSRIAGGAVQQVLKWPGSIELHPKIPTCLLYEQGDVLAWGLEAKNAQPMEGTTKCDWFKLFLSPRTLRAQAPPDARLPSPLPPGKEPIDLIADYLGRLWEYAKEQIIREIGGDAGALETADIWLTTPASWDAEGRSLMLEAALRAHLVYPSGPENREWKGRLKLGITESEAAAVHCAHLTDLYRLRPSQSFMIVDAGGGSVDLTTYRTLSSIPTLEIGSLSALSDPTCGSVHLDWLFLDLVTGLLGRLDGGSLAGFLHEFQHAKTVFRGLVDDDTTFQFTYLDPSSPDDPDIGLTNGELCIPGERLRKEVFDPIVDKILHLIETTLKTLDNPVDGLVLVGGFGGNEYLFNRIHAHFSQIPLITRPPPPPSQSQSQSRTQVSTEEGPESATLRGTARFALQSLGKGTGTGPGTGTGGAVGIGSMGIAPRSYVMKVKLPAEPADEQLRPAYISTNSAGVRVCENRLQYLLVKGAVMRKGQRITTKFCKYSTSPNDSHFPATLYTSPDASNTYRYADEASLSDLCKWHVDLAALPSFKQNASTASGGGFYTEFELGVELDCAEVRGILLSEGQEWGRVVFEYLN
ncbi:hypothetical protein BDV98DRAFT_534864 [Pterulicium gracile]|uniref:Actin-like ATPase domain-containing protein n=1 Tax=Pterulicium gracile TaxID=1884261 RepID=A0A5C3Q9S1_9AGAR|nr:hypothetical protein BDV98DRAFT_534864 [Pterula gracilis]